MTSYVSCITLNIYKEVGALWNQGDTLLSPTWVAILAGLETASLGLYAPNL